jgi:4-amino-4-deoxy-L-arabinose transferase-like glycosyltransferase
MESGDLPVSAPAPREGSRLQVWLAAPGLQADRYYRIWVIGVLGLAALNLFFRLWDGRINEWDEALHGIIAHEARESGRWVLTTYAGAPDYYFLKPPLGIWMVVASYWALGYHAFALRLPSALCALAGVALVVALGRRWFGRRVGLLAGLVLATSYPYVIQHAGRTGDLDAQFTLLTMVAMTCLLGLADRKLCAVGFGLALGLGFLLKSFAVIQLLVIAPIYLLLSRDLGRVRWARWSLAGAAAVAPVGLWAVARYHWDGLTFIGAMVREDLFHRTQATIGAPPYDPLYYAGFLLDRMAPWSELILAGGIWLGLRAFQREGQLEPRPKPLLLLIVWATVPFLLFSTSRTQHHWYINPTLPAIALLGALSARLLIRSRALASATAIVVLGGLVLGQYRIADHVLVGRGVMKDDQRFLLSLGDLGRGTQVQGVRRWTHTERFILQVVDGFRLDTRPPETARPRLLLMDATAAESAGRVLRRSGRYRLIESAPP